MHRYRSLIVAGVVLGGLLAGCGGGGTTTVTTAPPCVSSCPKPKPTPTPTPTPVPTAGCHVQPHNQQDPVCTPGVLNPEVVAKGVDATVCVSGYSSRVRPPVSVTGPWKLASLRAYGLGSDPRPYEYDHLIAIEDGGAPADQLNLWPQSRTTAGYTAARKDSLENYEHAQLCAHKQTLSGAQSDLTHWEATEARLNGQGVNLHGFSGRQNVGG